MKSPRFEFKTDLSPEEVQILSENSAKFLDTSSAAPPSTPLATFIFDPDSAQNAPPTLLGGIYAELQGSWLYIDTLWLDEKLRGQRYGIRLMQVVEQAAAERGVNRAFLGTSSFQAPNFYQQLGYQIVGQMPASIPDHSLFLLTRQPLTPYQLPPETELTLQDPPDEATANELGAKLKSFNDTQTGLLEQANLGGLFVYDENETLVGGGMAWRFGQWFGIQFLWDDPTSPHPNPAVEIIHRLESAAADQGRLIGTARTSYHHIAKWYEAAGYQNIAQIPDFPDGRAMHVLIKKLG